MSGFHPMTASLPTHRFRLERHKGVLFLRWTDTLSITLGDVQDLTEHLTIMAPENRPLLLVELDGMVTLSREAFVLAASLKLSAVACVGSGPVERVLVSHFGAVHQPPFPVEYFENRARALSWLQGRALIA
jgi:hypothetical protein